MDKRIILGTAGHIDHGKTALVKALTGVDTDRLKEEKLRGITIELGFAHLQLPSGLTLGIVDVPGHERFIDHMVAGASGMDMVLLVVAADEGVMPQTVEHMEICRQLGIRTGMVALTKVDLADEEMRSLAEEDVRDLVRGTFLEDKPVVGCSTVTGEGMEALLDALGSLAEQCPERRLHGVARMPIDRVFTMKGFGTVVTGTLLAGELSVGKTVDILPSGHRAKIRGIQVYNQTVPRAAAGSRTAINLQGIEKSVIQRGEVVVEPDRFRPSFRLYVFMKTQPRGERPLEDRFRVMVHWGTARVFGRVRFLEGAGPMKPGSEGFAQIHLEDPIFPLFGDRLILRDFSTNQTLGGAVVLDPHAEKFKAKSKETILPWMRRLLKEDPRDRILYLLWKEKYRGASVKDLALWTELDEEETANVCSDLAGQNTLVEVDPEHGTYVSRDAFLSVQADILEQVGRFHRDNPYQTGIPRESLSGKFKEPVPDRLVGLAVAGLSEAGALAVEKDRLRLGTHEVRLSGSDEAVTRRIQEVLIEQGTMPPTVKELAEKVRTPEADLHPLLDLLVHDEKIVKVNETLYFSKTVLEDLKNRLIDHLRQKGELLPGDFKDLIRASRKYTIPLMEYFDRTRLTMRLGDRRVLRK